MDNKLKIINKTTYYYDNKELLDFIDNLENKYNIYENLDYSSLINFSTNKDVPFHNWLKYREGYAGALVKTLMLDGNVKSGEIVVDPFCGSGTTSIVAKENGCIGFGCDINPMSSFITNVKLKTYSKTVLEKVLLEIKSVKRLNDELNVKKFDSIKKYFTNNNFVCLSNLKNWIDTIENNDIHDILLASFICIIETCSDRKKDGNGLKMFPTKINDVYDFYIKKTTDIVNDLQNISKTNFKYYTGYNFTLSALDFAEKCKEIIKYTNSSVGAIIFSPPYANSFDYLETYKLELVFGGFVNDIKGLNVLRKQALRSFIGVSNTINPNYYVNILANEILGAIPLKEAKTGKIDSRTRKVPNMIKGYFFDMEEVIKQCSYVLGKGKKMYIVVDQSSYLGKIVPTDLLLSYIAEKNGFTVDKILKTKNANTSAQQLRDYPYLKGFLRGTIIILKKN